jgi:hypothetical protein
MGNGESSSMHHNNNVPAIVRGVVGGLFVADTKALILTYVFFLAINTQPDQEEDRMCGFIYLRFLSFQIKFYFKIRIASPFSFGKTCGCSDMITGSFENLKFENSYNCDHWCLF